MKEIKGYFYKVLPGYFEEHIVNKFKEFFHKVSAMHLGEYFLKVLTMCLVGFEWAFCFRTHNELTMCLLGKCTLAPSVQRRLTRSDRMSIRFHSCIPITAA